MIDTFFFYLFATILVICATMVVSARNPVHSVLFLIACFFNAAALFLIAGAEFIAMILVIVYVGAVAVLFLFVVMMLDIDFSQLRDGLQRYAPVGAAIGLVLLIELGLVLGGWRFAPDHMALRLAPRAVDVANTEQIGKILYTRYLLPFQLSGLVLMVAMIGAIVLTLRDRPAGGVRLSRRQDIARQIARTPADTLVMMDVAIGAGVAELGILRPLPDAPAVPAIEASPHHDDGHGGAPQPAYPEHGEHG
jgi:NADH-quinone oxidoreductase subunit J